MRPSDEDPPMKTHPSQMASSSASSFGASLCACLVALAPAVAWGHEGPVGAPPSTDVPLDIRAWHVVERESGPEDYYRVVLDPTKPFIAARYVPPAKTTVLGFQTADRDRKRARGLRWEWRAITLPHGGDECASDRGDSAAVVYVTWKRFLKWYTLKYVWSAVGTVGRTCDRKRNPFVAQDTVILRSGPPLGEWRTESIDLASEYRRHFEDGRGDADVPDFVGVGLMTDGDQTHSESAADYAGFVLLE